MRISDILKQKSQGVSFEFFPPKTEAGRKILASNIQTLKEYNPFYVSMTYGAGGGARDRTKNAVCMLLEEKELVVMPHLTSVGSDNRNIEILLDEYKERGIHNIMVLRGDPPQGVGDFIFSEQEFSYAKDLVSFVNKYSDFCIGVAVYPEGHIETSSLDEDMEYTKQKVDAGADFAVTQMFFDNKYYFNLLGRMKKKDIAISVLPGILPLTDITKVKQFVSICRTTIPKEVEKEMQRFTGRPADMEKVGIDFTIRQCRDLIKNGIKQIHFFTLNKPGIIKRILDAI